MAATHQGRSTLSFQTVNPVPIGKEESKKLNQILTLIKDHNDSFEFRQPVDHVGLGLVDYEQIIKYPMDLGTVTKKLQNKQYKYVEECCDDIQMIWDNCKKYNADQSWIHKLADKMEKYFKKLLKNYLPALQIQNTKKVNQNILGVADIYEEEEPEGLSFSEKNKFSQKMKFLSQDQLGVIVKMIQDNCPGAFKSVDKDKCQILVDNLDIQTFKALQEQVDEYVSNTNENPSKKVKKNE